MRCIIGLAVLACASAAFAANPGTETRNFASYGVTLDVPKGAIVSPSLPQGVLFTYRPAGTLDGCSALVTPTTQTAAENAADFVRRNHAVELSDHMRIEGEPAVELGIASAGPQDPVKTILVAVHDGRGIVVTGYGADEAHANEAAENLAASVRFGKPQSPADDAELGTKAALRLGSREGFLSVTAMEWLHLSRQEQGQLSYAGHDFTQGKDRYFVAAAIGDSPQDRSFDDFLRTFSGEAKNKYHFTQDPVWTSSPADPHVFATQPLGPVTAADGTTAVWRFAIAQISAEKHVRMAFMITDTDDGRQLKYLAQTDKMIKELKVGSEPAPTAAADAAGK